MGFYITGSLTDGLGQTQTNFYSNIVHYFVDKGQGTLDVRIGCYTDKSASIDASPIYIEDWHENHPWGMFPCPLSSGSYSWGTDTQKYHLTQSEQVIVTTYSESWQNQLVDYIDYDEDGNEIIVQRSESIQVIHTGSEEVTKSRVDLDQITGSVYGYAYNKVREFFTDIYGADNVQNDI